MQGGERYNSISDRLKEEFGYQPQKTTAQVFDYFIEQARAQGDL